LGIGVHLVGRHGHHVAIVVALVGVHIGHWVGVGRVHGGVLPHGHVHGMRRVHVGWIVRRWWVSCIFHIAGACMIFLLFRRKTSVCLLLIFLNFPLFFLLFRITLVLVLAESGLVILMTVIPSARAFIFAVVYM
jgi:hypothetical protein